MSTQTKQTSTSQYDPQSMGVFSGLSKSFGQGIQDTVNNPYTNMAFNTQFARGNQAMGAQGASQNQLLLRNMQARGINPSSPAFFAAMNQQQRGQSSNQSGMYNNLLLQAGQLRQGALTQAGGYRPMQTGGTQTQSVGGLGSWLPQVAAAAFQGMNKAAMAGG